MNLGGSPTGGFHFIPLPGDCTSLHLILYRSEVVVIIVIVFVSQQVFLATADSINRMIFSSRLLALLLLSRVLASIIYYIPHYDFRSVFDEAAICQRI